MLTILTGVWIPITVDSDDEYVYGYMDWSLEPFPAKITVEFKTNMHPETSDAMLYFELNFYSGQDYIGALEVEYDSSSVEYYIGRCSTKWTDIPVKLLSDTENLWQLTLDRTSGIRLAIHVNDVKVMDELLSDCNNNEWKDRWTKDMTRMNVYYDYIETDSSFRVLIPGN